MLHSKPLTVSEELRVFLDVVCALETDMKAELLGSLSELVDIFKGAWLLSTPANTSVGATYEAL